MGPDIGTFIRRIQREVPDNTDTMIPCKCMESISLRECKILNVLLFFKRSAELPALFLEGIRFPVPEWIWPV